VHRDLKPANIAITAKGVVKVLDFGLAKTASVAHSADDQTTLITNVTGEGLIVGTAAYMSPEQARGQTVDKQTDVWAFGCVVYEMLAGRAAFSGETVSDTIAAVLERDPDYTALPVSTPRAVRRLVQRCLRKERQQRLHDIADARIEIEETLSPLESEEVGKHAQPPPRFSGLLASRRIIAVVVVLLSLAAASGWWVARRASVVETAAVRVEIAPPSGTKFVVGFSSVSPDGRFLAFVAQSPAGSKLWVRALDSESARELPETDGARFPFWSPDSRSVAFFASGKLRRIDITGGTPIDICNVPVGRGGTWNADGTVVYNAVNDGPLLQVSSEGGAPRPLTVLDVARRENSHRSPTFLPDGRHFLYFIRSDDREIQGIYVGSLDHPEQRIRVVASDFSAVYSPGLDSGPGYVLWLRNGSLVAQQFDAQRFKLSGEVLPVANGMRQIGGPNALSPVSVSREGTLIYGSSPEPHYQLTWYARDGKAIATMGASDAYFDLRISPDQQRIAVVRTDDANRGDIWLIDTARDVPNRLTFEGANISGLTWSPDGRQIAFVKAGSPPNLSLLTVTTPNMTQPLVTSPNTQTFPDWSPDGRFLLYAEDLNDPSSTTRTDLQLLPLDGSRTPMPYLSTRFSETRGRFSPDGKWVAYTSDESGGNEVYVQSFPAGGFKVRISSKGGDFARWRRDGKELFYTAPDDMLMAVPIQVAAHSLAVLEAKPLFKVPGRPSSYEIAADGQRILALPPADDTAGPAVTIVINWPALLKNRR